MGRYDARLARLERVAKNRSVIRERYVTLLLTASLEAAIEAAEKESGTVLLELDPLELSMEAWTDLAEAMLDAGMETMGQGETHGSTGIQ